MLCPPQYVDSVVSQAQDFLEKQNLFLTRSYFFVPESQVKTSYLASTCLSQFAEHQLSMLHGLDTESRANIVWFQPAFTTPQTHDGK